MRVLVTGKNGFLAKELSERFVNAGHNVTCQGRNDINYLDTTEVYDFFRRAQIDIVIHTAFIGDYREQTEQDLKDNLIMFYNIAGSRHYFGKMFWFGSGAEYDLDYNIRNVQSDLINFHTSDLYTNGKIEISNWTREDHSGDIYNLRLFGCFGLYEPEHRFIKSVIRCLREGKDPAITRDRVIDFFYVGDLYRVILHITNNNSTFPNEMNMCYRTKYSLTEIAEFIHKSRPDACISVEFPERGLYYTGDGSLLDTSMPNLDLVGLHKGIEEVMNCELAKQS